MPKYRRVHLTCPVSKAYSDSSICVEYSDISELSTSSSQPNMAMKPDVSQVCTYLQSGQLMSIGRGGSGNLNRVDKWTFRATAA